MDSENRQTVSNDIYHQTVAERYQKLGDVLKANGMLIEIGEELIWE